MEDGIRLDVRHRDEICVTFRVTPLSSSEICNGEMRIYL